jgi:hypothetical protein
VLVDLGAELVLVRLQVIQLRSGYQSPQAEGAGDVGTIGETAGPRCAACRLPPDGRVGYRVLAAPPVGESETSDPIDVIFVYCRRCGALIAHTTSWRQATVSGLVSSRAHYLCRSGHVRAAVSGCHGLLAGRCGHP